MAINVAQFEFVCNTTTGVQTIATGLGFTPKGYILQSFQNTSNATFQIHYNVITGFCDGTTGATMGMSAPDNLATSNSARHHRSPAVLEFRDLVSPEGTLDGYAEHSSFGSGTIVINWVDA